MSSNRTISLIVPVYNDAPYLRKCLESICGQTIIDEMEVIIVDDGSTDGSADIASAIFEEKKLSDHLSLIRLPANLGVANARIVGIGATSGQYIMFCDGDDWMDTTMCEKLLRKAESDNCDVVVCDYNKVLNGVVEPIGPCYKEPFLSQLILCSVTGSLCNKLIRSDLLKNSGFVYPTHDFSEDYVYNIQIAMAARKIGYVPEPLYYYLKRVDSLVRSQKPECCAKREADDEANYQLVLSILEKANLLEQYREELIFHKLRRKNHYRNNPKKWRGTYPELNREIFKSSFVSFRSRVAYVLTFFGLFKSR